MWNSVLLAVATITGIALIAGILLGLANSRLPADTDRLVEAINDLLPQTQCGQCNYPGCRPYAEAIASGAAGINICPPGGQDTVDRLAALLGRDSIALATDAQPAAALVAVIDEAACIGCAHCRDACPVDAIIGAQHFMHTVIADECTGCELCVAPCPVDCISMERVA